MPRFVMSDFSVPKAFSLFFILAFFLGFVNFSSAGWGCSWPNYCTSWSSCWTGSAPGDCTDWSDVCCTGSGSGGGGGGTTFPTCIGTNKMCKSQCDMGKENSTSETCSNSWEHCCESLPANCTTTYGGTCRNGFCGIDEDREYSAICAWGSEVCCKPKPVVQPQPTTYTCENTFGQTCQNFCGGSLGYGTCPSFQSCCAASVATYTCENTFGQTCSAFQPGPDYVVAVGTCQTGQTCYRRSNCTSMPSQYCDYSCPGGVADASAGLTGDCPIGQMCCIQVAVIQPPANPVPDICGKTFDTPGTYTWTAPAGVSKISLKIWGAGGGGGGRQSPQAGNEEGIAGNGGGGSGLLVAVAPVTAGQTYAVHVGAPRLLAAVPENAVCPGPQNQPSVELNNYSWVSSSASCPYSNNTFFLMAGAGNTGGDGSSTYAANGASNFTFFKGGNGGGLTGNTRNARGGGGGGAGGGGLGGTGDGGDGKDGDGPFLGGGNGGDEGMDGYSPGGGGGGSVSGNNFFAKGGTGKIIIECIINQPPVCALTATQDTSNPATFHFTAVANDNEGGAINSGTINFGDVAGAAAPHVMRPLSTAIDYTYPGTAASNSYTASLTVADSKGVQWTCTADAKYDLAPKTQVACNAGFTCTVAGAGNSCPSLYEKDSAKPACDDLAGGTVCCRRAVSSNSPPSDPQITGPLQGSVGTQYSFNIQSSDPENDKLNYTIDLDPIDGIADSWIPSQTTYVDSSTSVQMSRSWNLSGSYTFQASAADILGAQSGWTRHTINVLPSITANAGPDKTTKTNQTVILHGSASGGSLPYSYLWSLSQPDIACTLANSATSDVSIACSSIGQRTLTLSVKDQANKSDSDDAIVNVLNALPTTTVTIESPDQDASENGDTASIRIQRSGDTSFDLEVSYNIAGSATNGTDYQLIQDKITIPAGQAYINIALTPIDDAIAEGTETATFELNESPSYLTGAQKTTIVYISDNDTPKVPTCSFSNVSISQLTRQADFTINYANLPSGTEAAINFGDSTSENLGSLPATSASHIYGPGNSFKSTVTMKKNSSVIGNCSVNIVFSKVVIRSAENDLAGINLALDNVKYKIEDGKSIDILSKIERKDLQVGAVNYTFKFVKLTGGTTISQDYSVQFPDADATPDITAQKTTVPISGLEPGLYIASGSIEKIMSAAGADITSQDTVKSNNRESKTVVLYRIDKANAPEIEPVFLVLVLAAVVLLLRQ